MNLPAIILLNIVVFFMCRYAPVPDSLKYYLILTNIAFTSDFILYETTGRGLLDHLQNK